MQWRHWIGFACLVTIWGLTWLGVRVVVAEVAPITSAAVRFAVAAVLLAALAHWRGLKLGWRAQEPAGRNLMLVLSFFMIAAPYALVFWAEQFITAGLAAILFATHSAFVVLVESLYLRRNTLTPAILAGLLLAFSGVALIFWPQLGAPDEWSGSLAMLGAAASSSVAVVLAKHKGKGLNPVVSVTWQMAGGAVLLAVAALAVEGAPDLRMSAKAWMALGYLSVFGSCVAFVLFYWLLARLAPTQLSTMAFLTPIVAVTAGWLLLGERLGWLSLVGAAVALLGVGLLHYGQVRAQPAGGTI